MRAIDADAFKDYIRGACEDMKHLYKDNGAWAKEITESFCKDIDEQPTVSAEPHWIPVTERSPRKRDHKDDMVLVCNENGSIRFNTCINGTWVYGNPIAWMPLPEPYKGVTT